MKNKKKIATMLLVGLILVFGTVLGLRKINGVKKVEATELVEDAGQQGLWLTGEVDASEKANLGFYSAGKVAWVGVSEGDKVEKWQVLASLDKRSVEEALQKKLNEFDKSIMSLDQAKDDYRDEVLTDEVARKISTAEENLNNTVSDVELEHLSLEYLNLVSPISGVVIETNDVHAGAFVSLNQKWLEIVNPKSMYFSVLVDQEEVVMLREGMEGELELDAYPDKKIKVIVEKISLDLKSATLGTGYEVELSFDKGLMDLRLKMTGVVVFRLGG